MYFWLNPGHSRHAVDNLAVVLAQERTFPAARRLARASFRNYAMYLLDFLRLPSTHPTEAEHGALSAGWEHLDAALQGGKGAIVVTAHFGSWDRAIGLVAGAVTGRMRWSMSSGRQRSTPRCSGRDRATA